MPIELITNNEKQPILENDDKPTAPIQPMLPIRYIITCMCFLAFTFAYGIRMNLSISVLAMVRRNQTHSPDYNSTLQDTGLAPPLFDWNIDTQQDILGAFYIGYAFTPFAGGWLVGKVGGFPVLLLGMLLSSVAMISTPYAAGMSVGLLIFTRIVDGIGQGLIIPATFNVIEKWSKVTEHSSLVSIASSGSNFGPIVSSYLSVWLCSSQFLGGWPTTFYVYGICGVAWCIAWCIIGYSTKQWTIFESSRVSRSECKQAYTVPWKQMAKSPPVISLCVCICCFDFGYYLLLADIPMFLETILKFEIEITGLLAIMPHVVMFAITVTGGFVGDFLFSVVVTRKSFTFVGLGLSATAFISLGYVTDVTLSVIFVTIAFGAYGFIPTGIDANVMDIAPIHSGLLIGIMFSLSSCSGFIAPSVLGFLSLDQNGVYGWREIFWIAAGLQLFGLLAFLIFGSGEVQDWAEHETSTNDFEECEN